MDSPLGFACRKENGREGGTRIERNRADARRNAFTACLADRAGSRAERSSGRASVTGDRASHTNPASVGHTVKALMDEHVRMMGEIHAAQLEILRSNLFQQRTSVAGAVGAVASPSPWGQGGGAHLGANRPVCAYEPIFDASGSENPATPISNCEP